jgi:hypothetical protein
MVIRATSFKP